MPAVIGRRKTAQKEEVLSAANAVTKTTPM